MEEKLIVKERIVFLRAKLNKQGLDVDKLVTILKRDQLLPPEHVAGIEKLPTSAAKLDRLLDEIVSAKDSTYYRLLMAVEQCVPPALSPVFVTPPPYSPHRTAGKFMCVCVYVYKTYPPSRCMRGSVLQLIVCVHACESINL